MMNKCWGLTKENNVPSFGGKALQWEFKNRDYKTPIATRDNNILNLDQYNKKGQRQDDVKVFDKTEQEILQFIRDSLKARGARSIVSLGRKFKMVDNNARCDFKTNNNKTNGQGSLDKHEFKQCMTEMRFYLSDSQLKTAFECFDRNRDGVISYEEFIGAIVGDMNDFRKKYVEKAFKVIDADNDKVITVKELKARYNAASHPDELSGKKTEWETYEEFLGTFEQHFCDKNGNEASRDRIITYEDFFQYYSCISMSIDDDKYFELMMVNAWGLGPEGKSNQLKIGWSNNEAERFGQRNVASIKDNYK